MGGDVSKNFRIVEHIDLSGLSSNPTKEHGFSWSLSRAIPTTDGLDSSAESEGEEFSVFDYGENHIQYSNTLQILRSIRHPNVITILCDPCRRKPEGRRIATHLVEPLGRVLPGLDFQEVMGGIHDIARALSFLHTSAGICHNEVGLHSIFVAKDGTWKLGCFESARRACSEGFSGDVKDLVAMLEVLLKKLENLKDEDLQSLVDLHKELEHVLSQSSEPESSSSQFHLSTCLSSQVFQKHKFVRIRTFLSELPVKSAEEKDEFFRSLISELTQLPEELVAKRLSILLLQRFVLLDRTAREFFLPLFLTPKEGHASEPGMNPVLSLSLFECHIRPVLMKVFTVHDASIRAALLENFKRYFRCFTRQQLQEVILNELLLSARDQNDHLVELSLRALADLVCVLGGDLVIRSQRVQHFYDGQMKEQKLPQTSTASGFDPAHLESGKHLTRKTQEKLDGLLKVERKSDQVRDAKTSKDWRKVLVNTVDLSDQKVKAGVQKANVDPKDISRKDKTCPEHPVDKEDRGSQPSLLGRLENWGADDSMLTDAIRLDDDDDDLVRSKSLESLYKNRASRLTKPVAVIEPKTIYQLSNEFSSETMKAKDVGRDSEKGVATQVWSEARTDNSSCSTLQNKADDTQKIMMQAKDIPQGIKTTVDNKGNNIKPVTLLDISQSSVKIQSKPLSLKISHTSKDINMKHPRDEDECSEWDDKWEDLEVPSITEDQPKTPTNPPHLSSNKKHTGSTNPLHSPPGQLVSGIPNRLIEKSKAIWPSNHHPKVSEEPLGFGYDIKQIRVKVKPGAGVDEDDEWKLFEDLMPSLEPQKKSCDYKSATLNIWDSTTTQGSESRTRNADELGASGWEAEEMDIDLE